MEKKKLIDPSEVEIKLSFHNYKLLKKEEFNLKGSHIYFIKGPNETGKSSVLQALRAAHEIKDDTPTKVSRGEIEGVNEFTIPGPDGKMYNVICQFNDSTTKFVVFDEEGNKISKITDMRNIFKYNHVDATSFIGWSYNADGRRKQKELILQLLPSELYIKFQDYENEEKLLFDKRTAINKTVELNDKLRSEYQLTSVELEIQKNLNPAIEQLNNRETSYNKALLSGSELDKVLIDLNGAKAEKKRVFTYVTELEERIAELQKLLKEENALLDKVTKNEEYLITSYEKLNKEQQETDAQKEKLKVSVETGREYVTKAKALTEQLKKYNEADKVYHESVESANNLTEAIEGSRNAKEKLITDAKFPVDNLSFDEEGYLTIDGFRFDEKQTCESDTILIVAQLMCKMNETPIQILGDASLLDYTKLDKLYKIAEDNGKIMFVDEIDRKSNKLVIVGYERENKTNKSDKPSNPLF